jgi:hypothetical protein
MAGTTDALITSYMVNLIKPEPEGQGESTFEFYTVESGMSQSGLAVLCGVTQQAISDLEKTLTSKAPSKWLEPFVGEDFTLASTEVDPALTVNNRKVGRLTVCRANFCVRVVQHYAFRGNEVAQYNS